MQFVHPPAILPVSEYSRLQRLMLTMVGSRTALASMLRRKLGASRPAPTVPEDVALSGMRVRYRIDGVHSDERVLSWEPARRGDDTRLSLRSARGLALLGLCPGELVCYRTEDDRTEYLEVERVSPSTERGTPGVGLLRSGAIVGQMPVLSLSGGTMAGGLDA